MLTGQHARHSTIRPPVHLIVVVPCYNEEHRLPVEEFRRFRLDGARVEFCFVNDGSTDGTLRLIESLAAEDPARFCVVNLDRNRGKAEAVRRGMLEAFAKKPDLVGFWDADLATPLDQIGEFLKVFSERPEIEMVFAARVRLLGRSISRDPRRHYVGRAGATLISSSLGLAVYDTQCGAKLFRVSDAMQEIFAAPFLSRWIFDVEIIARFVRMRGREAAARAIYELPIMVWHDVKGSKVKSTDFLRALKDLWKIHRAYNRRR
jgi:glycosyltransferase involved in cell wall biosynthesis